MATSKHCIPEISRNYAIPDFSCNVEFFQKSPCDYSHFEKASTMWSAPSKISLIREVTM